MNAVVFDRLNHLQFCEDYPMPVCRPGWAVVKVMSAGICATDLEILKGAFGQPPCVIGHEICGIVTEAAPDVTACRVGDRVVVETAVSCGHCAHCQSGNKHLCEDCIEVGFPQIDGGYAQYVACPAGCLHKIPENIRYDEGGILEACLCPFGLIYRNGMHLDETVLIQGAGVAGLSFLQSVKLFSPRKVLVAVRKDSAEPLRRGRGHQHRTRRPVPACRRGNRRSGRHPLHRRCGCKNDHRKRGSTDCKGRTVYSLRSAGPADAD